MVTAQDEPLVTIPPLTDTMTQAQVDALAAELALNDRANALSERDKMLAGEM